ncbi:hypothetical protein [Streptomyces sp. DH10]|uniref:hypothetical protein n=1 Tax=Streptomyces sp. DH10 TaxID=3040121 RepID=UPI00244155C4|nr:hypothetical protein [Streptomyces sp. DH10]MDG9707989.1 hypothetical protein [Streptomyces sp. DH10]
MGRVRFFAGQSFAVRGYAVWVAAVAGLVTGVAAPAFGAPATGAPAAGAPASGTPVSGAAPAVGRHGSEAGLAYHGSASLSAGHVDLAFTPRNHGTAAVADATVRLRWSEPLADRQELPVGCARSGRQAVLCRTGALAADGVGERIALRVRLPGAPPEVVLDLDTVWVGGAVDRARREERQRVLVLDTGDPYHF